MASFQYSSLGPRQIRLVKLASHAKSGPIRCDLIHVSSADDPGYVALSYAWGDPEDTCAMLLNDRPFQITKNLASALSQMQTSKDRDIPVWIDAICIDQRNIQERNEQVQHMREIYQRAVAVFVWLGPEADSSGLALDLIRQLSRDFELFMENWAKYAPNMSSPLEMERMQESLQQRPIIGTLDRPLGVPYSPQHWHALRLLLRRSWFMRLWTVQEVAVASNVVIGCGNDAILWKTLEGCAMFLGQHDGRYPAANNLDRSGYKGLHIFIISRDNNLPQNRNLYSLVRRCFERQATDPRDKVYALVGLSGVASIEIDYAKSVAEVYTEFWKWALEHESHLDLLSAVQFPKAISDLPSWVPDWTIPGRQNPLPQNIYSTAGPSSPSVRFSNEMKSMTVKGILIDVIETVGVVAHANSRADIATPAQWESVAYTFGSNEVQGRMDPTSYISGCTRSEAFWRTMAADHLPAGPTHERIPPGTSPSEIFRAKQLPPSDAELTSLERRLITAISVATANRRLFLTSRGYIGLAPAHAQVGDITCVIFGSKVPLLLRPALHHYEFVGETYVHGIMDGESITAWEKGDVQEMEFEIQ